jgi:predicted phage tail protein
MKTLLYILLLLISFNVMAQQKTLEISNINNGKIKVYTENQRIKVRTLDGKKHVGNLNFSDNETIIINNQSIKIDSVLSIKKQPKILGTIRTVVLVTGLAIVSSSIIVAASGGNAAFLLFTVGSGVTISAGLIEAINSNNSNRLWKFKIVDPSLKVELEKQKQ